MKVGVVLPTRGLVFTRVEESLESFRQDYDLTVYRSSDLPIPEGHNQLTEKALQDGCDYIWFVEEDTVPPARSLEKLLAADADIACIDYGVSGWSCVAKSTEGEILWCGLGCTLVKRKVLLALERPYFRVDKALRLNDWTWTDLPANYVANRAYGSLDIWFCWQARLAGFQIKQVEGEEADHLKLDALGQREVNNGLHTISPKPKIAKKQIISKGGEK